MKLPGVADEENPSSKSTVWVGKSVSGGHDVVLEPGAGNATGVSVKVEPVLAAVS